MQQCNNMVQQQHNKEKKKQEINSNYDHADGTKQMKMFNHQED